MYKKAVLISADNEFYISTRFDIQEEEIKDLIGFYLVTDFGDEDQYSFLSTAALDKLYLRTETELDNGFFEVIRK